MVAIAISIALHETAAGLIAPWPATAESAPERVQRVTLTRIAVRPTPTPSPAPIAEAIAPVPARAVPAAAHRTRRAAKLPAPAAAAPPLPAAASSNAPVLVAGPVAPGEGAAGGAESSASAGSSNGTPGATGGGETPCGAVTFADPHGSRFDPATRGFYVDIRIAVHFRDGHAESAMLDYPFYYANEAANPWSDRNRSNPGVPMLMQSPPAPLAAGEPPLVQYVMQHTDAEGFTTLEDCPPPVPATERR